MEKRRTFSTIFSLLDFRAKTGTGFSLRDKQLFEMVYFTKFQANLRIPCFEGIRGQSRDVNKK